MAAAGHSGSEVGGLSVPGHIRMPLLVYGDATEVFIAAAAQVGRILQHRVDGEGPAGIIGRQREAYVVVRPEHIASGNLPGADRQSPDRPRACACVPLLPPYARSTRPGH